MKVLIANRGEIALRIRSTLDRMGIESVGIHTQADAASTSAHSVLVSSYLAGTEIIKVAKDCGCDAIHPGYGFLSENPAFVAECEAAGLIFIGPSSQVVRDMGEKIRARELAAAAGLPIVPGIAGVTDLVGAAQQIGFPLLVKPSAGGGGKGLHLVHNAEELAHVLPTAEREAIAAFGDGTLFLERYIARPRHIEFQIVADAHGNVMHLGERECSMQRRHQKVIEETPSTLLTPAMRERMGSAAVSLAKSIGYRNVGTVEFLVSADDPEEFYFIEMNTRLQVEHRVTEMVTGLDLVELQVRIAQGESLKDVVGQLNSQGHSIQARIYAEDPENGFLPTGGPVLDYATPDGVLIDSALKIGQRVNSSYDPMLAKVIVHGVDRDDAIDKLSQALKEFLLFGLVTNIEYCHWLINTPEHRRGEFDTHYIADHPWGRVPTDSAKSAYANALVTGSGFRLNAPAHEEVRGYYRGVGFSATSNGQSSIALVDGDEVWVHQDGNWLFTRRNPRPRASSASGSVVESPMPGIVIAKNVNEGDEVSAGQPLLVIEAMKMEHILRAPMAGRVSRCTVEVGDGVQARQLLLEVIA